MIPESLGAGGLACVGVSLTYSRGRETVKALDNVSVQFHPGQLTMVLGPSGGGKSSLLQVLGGMDRPSAGHVLAGSVDITSLKASELARWRRTAVGFVFQRFYLLPGRSALDNAALPLLLRGQGRAASRNRVRQVLERLGLESRLGHRPEELSGGQLQRVAIARALAHNPAIILADEPTGSLDSRQARDIVEQLRQLAHEDGRTVVMATHNEQLVDWADRVIRMQDGVIVSDKLKKPPRQAKPIWTESWLSARRGPAVWTLLGEAVRALWRRLVRTFLMMLAVAIGVGSLVLLVAIGAGLKSTVITNILGASALNAITVTASPGPMQGVFATSGGSGQPLTPARIEQFRRLPGVRGAFGMGTIMVTLGFGNRAVPALVAPLVPQAAEGGGGPLLLAGTLPTSTRPGLVLLPAAAESLFGLDSRRVGEAVGRTATVEISQSTAPAVTTLPVSGVLASTLVQTNYVDYATGQAWLGLATPGGRPVTYPFAIVYATGPDQVGPVAARLAAEGLGVTTTQAVIRDVERGFKVVEAGLGVIGAIGLVVAGLMIGVVMSMAVLERRQEIAIWRAVGARRRDIFGLFLLEAMIIGMLGGAAGDALAWVGGRVGASFWAHQQLAVIPPELALLGLAFGTVIAAVSGILPAFRAAGLNPAGVLRQE